MQVIDEWVKGEVNRAILKDRYINGLTYEKLAEKHNLSVSTVKRTLDRYNPIFFKHLDKSLQQENENFEITPVMIAIPT